MKPDRSRLGNRLDRILFHLLLATAVGLAGWLSLRYEQVFDWSDQARNSLSPVSVELLSRLQAPLKIDSFAPANDALRDRIRAVIEPYRRVRPDITLQFVDPASQPQLTREAGVRLAGELRISYQGRSENLGQLDEQSISNTIQRLMQSGERWIVAVGGHGERDLEGRANHDLGRFGAALREKGYRLQTLDLGSQAAIPRNSDLLILAGPRVAFLPGELVLVREYLESGGNLLWLTDPGPQHDIPELLRETGLQVLPGTVVDANAASLGLDNPAIAVVNRFPEHPATDGFRLVTLYPFASALLAEPQGEWQAIPLLQTQAGSWNETSELKGELKRDPQQGEVSGPLTLGYAFSRVREDGNQRLVVIGDGDFLSNSYLGNGGNLALGMNLVRWLSADDHLLQIPPTTARDTRLELDRTTGAILGLGFLFLLPLLLIGGGLLVRWHRRRG